MSEILPFHFKSIKQEIYHLKYDDIDESETLVVVMSNSFQAHGL